LTQLALLAAVELGDGPLVFGFGGDAGCDLSDSPAASWLLIAVQLGFVGG
jgi:hypothetical protein